MTGGMAAQTGEVYMKIRWRQWQKGLSSREYSYVGDLPRKAEQFVLEEEVGRRCAAADSGLADCANLRVRGTGAVWGRCGGNIYFRVFVHTSWGGGSRWVNWRVRIPQSHRKAG